MRRAVTAIYRSYDVAALVRDELERLGIGRRHIRIIPDAERGNASSAAGSTQTTGRHRPRARPAALMSACPRELGLV
jgi:hypothetical protein